MSDHRRTGCNHGERGARVDDSSGSGEDILVGTVPNLLVNTPESVRWARWRYWPFREEQRCQKVAYRHREKPYTKLIEPTNLLFYSAGS